MFATKETSLLLFAAAWVALVFVKPWRDPETIFVVHRKGARLRQIAAGLAAFAVPAALLYSSFLRNPKGIVDSVLSFGGYFQKAGEAGAHAQPWHYYLGSLAFFREGKGPVWTEALILVLGIVGGVAAFALKKRTSSAPMRFVAAFTLVAAVVYSAIPYKTPWNVLPFFAGAVILAGEGAVVLVESLKGRAVRVAAGAVLLAGFVHLGVQCRRASFVLHSDPRNPWVYAQTIGDVRNLVRRLDSLSRGRPEGRDMLIKVVASPSETWPLPWYLRGYRQVGYWTEPEAAGGFEGVPAVVCSVEAAQALEPVLDRGYRAEYFGLRPGVLVCLYYAVR
jgi:predicted membrane-bound mannosyltransferase